MRVRLVVDGDRAIVDYTGSDPQARGPDQRALRRDRLGDLQRASCQLSGTRDPASTPGTLRLPDDRSRRPGTVVNVRLPGAVAWAARPRSSRARRDALRRARRARCPSACRPPRAATSLQLPLRRRPPAHRRATTRTTTSRRAAGAAALDGDGTTPRTRRTATAATRRSRSSRRASRCRTLAYGLEPGLGRARAGPRRARACGATSRCSAPEVTASAHVRPRRARRPGASSAAARPCAALSCAAPATTASGLLRGVRHGQPVEARGRRPARGRRRPDRERRRRRLRRPARARPGARAPRRARRAWSAGTRRSGPTASR